MSRRNHDRTFGLIDRSTGDDAPHVARRYQLRSDLPGVGPQEWVFTIKIPAAIADVVGSDDWAPVLAVFETKRGPQQLSPFEELLILTRVETSNVHAVEEKINKMVGRCIYHQFVKAQIAKGDHAWIAPKLSGAQGA